MLQILWSGFKSIRITPPPLSSFTLQVSNFQKIFFFCHFIEEFEQKFYMTNAVKGNWLKSIANKTVRIQGFTKLHHLLTYVCSLLRTHFNIKNGSKLQVIKKWFWMEPYIWPTLLVKVERKKKSSWNFWLSPSNKPNRQIEPHPTRWQYPLMKYLSSVHKNQIKLLLKKWTKQNFWK